MSPSSRPSRTLVVDSVQPVSEVRSRERRLAYARYHLGNTRWWQSERSRARRDLRQAKAALTAAQAAADEIDWETVAGNLAHQVLDSVLSDMRHSGTTHQYNAFSRRTLHHLGATSARVVAHLRAAEVTNSWENHRHGLVTPIRDLPVLRGLCADREWVASVIAKEVFRRDAIARTDDYLHTQPSGLDSYIVQHRPTGLRIRMNPGAQGIGSITAKSANIESIDDERPGTLTYFDEWVGLGIGTELYRRGAALLPAHRWASGAAQPSAHRVRRKLHQESPYIWRASCTWCAANIHSWEQAAESAFAGHP